jgi:hypothetical protein
MLVLFIESYILGGVFLMTEYLVNVDNLPKLEKKLATIEKKCRTYGCDFTYKQVGEVFREWLWDTRAGCKELEDPKKNYDNVMFGDNPRFVRMGKFEKYVVLEVEGTAIVSGWEFVATLEHTPDGNIVRTYNNDFNIPERYLTSKSVCEHCGTNRKRKDTYLVRNVETMEYKQVGKSCLRDYTKGMSAEFVSTFWSAFDTFKEFSAMPGGGSENYVNTYEFLLHTVETIKHYGFMSKSRAQELWECGESAETTVNKV